MSNREMGKVDTMQAWKSILPNEPQGIDPHHTPQNHPFLSLKELSRDSSLFWSHPSPLSPACH